MIGMGERTTPQAVTWIARSLFRAGSATQVLAVHLPKSRFYMHLDTVITVCDRDLVTLFPQSNATRRSEPTVGGWLHRSRPWLELECAPGQDLQCCGRPALAETGGTRPRRSGTYSRSREV